MKRFLLTLLVAEPPLGVTQAPVREVSFRRGRVSITHSA